MAQLSDFEALSKYEPFNEENYLSSCGALGWTTIVTFEVPSGMVAVLESYNIWASHPQVFHQCQFEIAIDNVRFNSIVFQAYPSPADRPYELAKWINESQTVALRVNRTLSITNGSYPALVFGRLSGRMRKKVSG